MINIIREDLSINPDLQRFPSAHANIAIFGTQSSGKSTLLNHVFGTKFPVLDTAITRERCTKGLWLHNVSNFNVIDTEGFDSSEREAHQKIFEKQVALFCLALSDVLIINMWMNEVGRYEASHSHVLKAIIHASQMLISKQQRKIVFVVRDCTDDADRSILRDELNSQMMGIVKAQTKKSNIRFNLDYFMMSPFYENQKQFKKEAKELLKLISMTKKSNLSNYSDQDRMVYVKNLWSKVTTDSQIDLRTAEEALRSFALERIRKETIYYMENWLDSLESLQQFKTYQRFKEAAAKEARVYFMEQKPKHLRQQQVESYIESILQTLDSRQNKYFMTVLLPNEEDRLIEQQYRKKIDALMGDNVVYFKRNMERRRQEIQDDYRVVVRGLREHAKMTRRFIEKIEAANNHYEQYLEHLQNVFKIQLETALNEEIDKQTKELSFDAGRIKKVISIVEEKHKAESKADLPFIWDRIVARTSNSTIVDKLKNQGEGFSTVSLGAFMGNQSQLIIAYYRKLQDKAEKYLWNVMNFLNEEEETTASLERVESIRKLINQLIEAKIIEQAKRFKITLVFVAFIMYFFFSEFRFFLKVLGLGKRRLRNWMYLYTFTMLSLFGIIIYRKRDYFRKFIEPLE